MECDACNGTRIEEGEAWNGTPCRKCKGVGWIADEGEDTEIAAKLNELNKPKEG